MRIWHIGWEGTNDTLVACDSRDCVAFAPTFVTQKTGEDGAQRMSGWVYLPDYDTPPGAAGEGPTIHAWFDPGNSYVMQSTLQLEQSVIFEVPEPSQSAMYATVLLVIGLLHRRRR